MWKIIRVLSTGWIRCFFLDPELLESRIRIQTKFSKLFRIHNKFLIRINIPTVTEAPIFKNAKTDIYIICCWLGLRMSGSRPEPTGMSSTWWTSRCSSSTLRWGNKSLDKQTISYFFKFIFLV